MGRPPIDLTGKKFNSLLVLHRTTQEEHPHKSGAGYHAIWTCLCDCGKITFVQGNDLRNGHIKSCGHDGVIDITGQTFNRLTAVRKVDPKEYDYDTDEGAIWECKCSCGKITYVRGVDIRQGRIKSCGCLRDEVAKENLSKRGPSLGEEKIIKILQKEKIKFEREKSFSDEKRIANYRFDFYLPEFNACIEFQGMQHMVFTPYFHKTKTEFKKAQERDRRKISYCLSHGIKLYCIPYWELDNLHTFSDLTHPQFLAKTKFHNDIAYRNHSPD